MGTKDKSYSQLIGYLERRGISQKEAIDIIEATTPEGQKENQKFNWKMLRLTLYLWERVEQDKKGHLWSKTDTCKEVVKGNNYRKLWDGFNDTGRFDLPNEQKKLFKLVTDPRQRMAYFKTRFFKYKGTEKNIPQDVINKLVSGIPKK